jgi:hypothetical protein
MAPPATIRAGDTVVWEDSPTTDVVGNAIDSSTYTLTTYLRFNTASEGATAVAVANGTGWRTTITAATSANFDAGTWYWQSIATAGTVSYTIGSGQLRVERSLAYSGTPGAVDGRTQAQQDLDAVQAAIRAMVAGGAVQKYTIGNRSLDKIPMADLLRLESKLKAEVNRELRAAKIAQGLGDPRSLYVRFT